MLRYEKVWDLAWFEGKNTPSGGRGKRGYLPRVSALSPSKTSIVDISVSVMFTST
jgi:hypothetical protein